MLGAAPAVAAGFFVLFISDVGRSVWLMQGGSVVLMLAVVAVMTVMPRFPTRSGRALMACASVVLCALPLLGDRRGPQRWITLGHVSLYIAPVVLPTLLALAAHTSRWGGRWEFASVAGLWVVACVLACQPDLSQVLALTAGAAIIIARDRVPWARRLLMLLPFAAAGCLAAVHVDPLTPVGHVEHVVLVSWRYSMLAGLGVSLAALVLVVSVAVRLARIDASMVAVAAYYGVLFICSIAGLTPAPLIGYGAGPLLGFGLLAGTTAILVEDHLTLGSR